MDEINLKKKSGLDIGQDAEIQYLEVTKQPIYMSNIVKSYFRILEVISSLNVDFNDCFGVGRKPKMTDIEVIALSLTAEFMSIDSENALFHHFDISQISNLIKRIQYNKKRKKLFMFSEIIRKSLANQFLEFEDCFVVDSMPLEICKKSRENRIKICKEDFETSPENA